MNRFVLRLFMAASAVHLLTSCWHLLEPAAWVYEEVHPPPTCDAGVPGDGRGYSCELDDGGFGGGPGHWVCVSGSGALLCDGGAR